MVDDCENSLLEVIRVLVGGETKLLDKNTWILEASNGGLGSKGMLEEERDRNKPFCLKKGKNPGIRRL